MRRRNLPPTEAPEFFLDRGLGKRVAEGLADAGWTTHPMFKVFPRSDRKKIEDVNWIPEVAQWGWVILAKDSFRLPQERRMISRCGVRVFTIPNANLRAEAMIERFLTNEERIRNACRSDGPFHYSVSHDRLRVVELLR